MIKVLVVLPLIGRFTILSSGTARTSNNDRAGSGAVPPVLLLAYSKMDEATNRNAHPEG